MMAAAVAPTEAVAEENKNFKHTFFSIFNRRNVMVMFKKPSFITGHSLVISGGRIAGE